MNSLRLQLHLLLLGGLLLLLVVQGLGVQWIPQTLVKDYLLTRLSHDAETLYARLLLAEQVPEQIEPTLGTVYDTPLSGHYFRIDIGPQVIRSRSLWDEDLAAPPADSGVASMVMGPAGQPLLVYTRHDRIHGQTVTIRVAEDMSAMARTVRELEQWLLGLSVLALLLVLLMQVWILRRALHPLHRAVQACEALESGQVQDVNEAGPHELRPLLQALNRLSRYHGLRLARSRRALGNVSHALKTPLAVLRQQSDALAQRGDHTGAQAMREQLEAMAHTISRELHRARLAGSGSPGAHFDARQELTALSEALIKLHQGRVQIDVAVEGAPCALDADDMLELFGNLLDNACKWAASQVVVQVSVDQQALRAQIADDGPGVAEADWSRLTHAGQRLDETRPGHGLGLGIVQDIVDQYQGQLSFARSATLGGLQVSVLIPLRWSDGGLAVQADALD